MPRLKFRFCTPVSPHKIIFESVEVTSCASNFDRYIYLLKIMPSWEQEMCHTLYNYSIPMDILSQYEFEIQQKNIQIKGTVEWDGFLAFLVHTGLSRLSLFYTNITPIQISMAPATNKQLTIIKGAVSRDFLLLCMNQFPPSPIIFR